MDSYSRWLGGELPTVSDSGENLVAILDGSKAGMQF